MMEKQMELFEEGGLKDEGGMIDEESGNEVPVGGTRKGVRDDIPANISEGEFIFPEDVTRYIGLDKLMQLRQEAKMGLKRMEAMGQMGNSDEAIIDDDLPFDMADLIIVSGPEGEDDTELDMAVGGVTMQPNQVRRLGGAPSTDISTVNAPTTTPLTSQSAGVRRLTPEPTNEEVAQPTLSFKELMGDAYLEMFEYRNEAGEVLMVPHLDGKPVYEVPPGYTVYNPSTAPEGDTGSVVAGDADAAPVVEALAAVNSDKERPVTEPPKPPVDWDNLSTEDFINEAAGLTGMSRTVANGVTMFMGPLGFIASAMMKHQDKNVISKIDARLAAGGLTSAEVAELKRLRASLQKSSGGLLSKIIETVGNFFNKDKETIEAVKAQAEKLDATATQVAAQQTEIEKIIASLSEEDKNIIAEGREVEDVVLDLALNNGMTEEGRKFLTTINQEDVANIVGGENVADITDAIREGVSQLTPIGEVATQAPDRTFRDMTQTAPNFEASVVAPTVSPEKTVMSQPVTDPRVDTSTLAGIAAASGTPTPAMSPEEVVMSQPVVSTVNQQTEAAFQPTVVRTTGTGAGRDFADMPVTGEQIAYASAAESKDQPYDPRNITRVPSEQVTNIPVTAEAQTNVSGMTSPSIETGTGMGTPVSDAFYRSAEPSKLAPSGTLLPKVDTYNSTQDTFGEDYTPTSAELNKQLADAGKVNLTTLTGIAADSGTASTDITTTAPAATQTFSDAFAANRAAGNDTFTFEGKSYTTQTKEEATAAAKPAGSNNLYEAAANFITPNDGKEYVNGVLVDSSTKKPIVTESSNTTSSNTTTRSTQDVQNEINKALKDSGGEWTSELNDLVAERDAAKKAKKANTGGSSGSSGSSE